MRTPAGLLALLAPLLGYGQLPSQIRFEAGPVNSVRVGSGLAVYSAGKDATGVTRVLVTEARRDSIGVVPPGTLLIVPAPLQRSFTDPAAFWNNLEKARFHDYAQNTTKVPVRRYQKVEGVVGGAAISAGGLQIKTIDTPGYSPGAVSYLIETPTARVVCTGNLILGDGQIRDLFSLQDAIPEAKARGYHGYAARAGDLIASLRKIAALKPDLLLPAHGPPVTAPQQSIERLIDRLQRFLKSHFETDALRWYWGDENHRIRSRAVERPMDIMPMAEMEKLPEDIRAVGNSRIILSKTGAAFVVDAGNKRVLPELRRLKSEGTIRNVDGIWITHYHDDHTDFVNDLVAEFGSKVYFTQGMAEVMGNPAGFRLPCLTTRPISIQNAQRDGATLRWKEWHLTFWNFPGQTLYHGGLVARRGKNGQSYLFVGDSFTPSGMDDYCMQNRDFLRAGEGYDYCLRKISELPKSTWLMNQHVDPMFRYSDDQMQRMKAELARRSAVLAEMSPWPDINYMVDESWARIFPYGQSAKAGSVVRLSLRITNHAPAAATYRLKWNLPEGWEQITGSNSLTVPPRRDGSIGASFRAPSPGLHVITADLGFGDRELPAWVEALVRIE